jgi:hypothetical protein
MYFKIKSQRQELINFNLFKPQATSSTYHVKQVTIHYEVTLRSMEKASDGQGNWNLIPARLKLYVRFIYSSIDLRSGYPIQSEEEMS